MYTTPFLTMPFERWLPIPTNLEELPNLREGYWISDWGRLVSTIRGDTPKLMHPNYNTDGYRGFSFASNEPNVRMYRTIHRIEMITFQFVPNYRDLEVNHKNGVKDDNYICNLEWVTPSENMRHAYDQKLHIPIGGENHYLSGATNAQAEQVAQLLLTRKYSHQQIADMVGISIAIVHSIASGGSRRWIYEKYNLASLEPRFGRNNAFTLLSEDEINAICKFLFDNGISLENLHGRKGKDLKIQALNLIGKEYNYVNGRLVYKIRAGQQYTQISSKYGF